MNEARKDQLVIAGVRNLKEFGYPSVSASNILTDMVYSRFFKSMLDDNRGKGFDVEIDALVSEMDIGA